ncbi:(S)-beta-bisabolene synthase [Plakobranchus ocellatus]|uniref:(S)-beta-bisabolene synthase n=1 Tax=Plakobranchus ocellatus TaxID=259542 RepID=A0AAV3Y137_9GAST|nr:(S)-beta-bisabolene synthase [Plakobranchus ocellatus]
MKGEHKEWKRWQKTEKCNKDLVTNCNTLSDIINIFESDLVLLGKHLVTAQWQRKQYQFLAENLPPGHAMCTADFAVNYLCKFQNEVQSAHWSYRQVTVRPCVFFTDAPKKAAKKE